MSEAPADKLLGIFKASIYLASAAKTRLAYYLERDGKCPENETLFELDKNWTPHLQMLKHIQYYIFQPCTMASGHRNASHKAGVINHQFYFDRPLSVGHEDYA